jgi:hypothetical protein
VIQLVEIVARIHAHNVQIIEHLLLLPTKV